MPGGSYSFQSLCCKDVVNIDMEKRMVYNILSL